MELDSLVVKIRASVEGFQEAVDAVKAAQEQIRQANTAAAATAQKSADTQVTAANQVGQANTAAAATAQQKAKEQIAAYATIAAAAAAAFKTIISAVNESIDAHNRYAASIQGLASVASGRGIGEEKISKALEQLTDQFFDTASASTALKNLLSRGYTLDQAIESITRLKDAAAFGRQASYGLAEAVVSATEGLKNENSILVNAA